MLTPSQFYWQQVRTFTHGGKTFRCTRRTHSALLKIEKALRVKYPNANGPGKPAYLRIMQGCYNDTVAASAGTHDKDSVIDAQIVGLSWAKGEAFFRWSGWFGWHRKPSEGPWGDHLHVGLIPPGIPTNKPTLAQIEAAYRKRGIEVGKYVPGQLHDYYHRKNGMRGHGPDHSPRPQNIGASVFRPKGY